MKCLGWFLATTVFFTSFCFAQNVSETIKINQEGYLPQEKKIAALTGNYPAKNFCIISVGSNDTVFCGRLSDEKHSSYSSTITRIADFSNFKKHGYFFIYIPGIGNSYHFKISRDAYHKVSVAVIKGYYYLRSNISLEEKFAGQWKRPAGHPDTIVYIHPSAANAERHAGTIISSAGGWYDAGDYNKYIVNCGITMGTLLSAYEDFPNYFDTLKTNIPESDDAVPDILNEVLYNLRWMFTMQDPYDGGVYHKLTNAAFDGMVMPGITKDKRYVVQKSTAATLDFAAVMAQASRVFKKFKKQLPHLADSCLRAAMKAWNWAEKNPDIIYDQKILNQKYDPDITTGEYGDKFLNDEWLWSAAELYATTKNKNYYTVVEKRIKDTVSLPSWSNVAMLGYYTLIRNEKKLNEMKTKIQLMKNRVLKIANEYLMKQPGNAFKTVMGQSKRDFIWGSNSVAANQGVLLINAFLITKNKNYIDGALSNLDYLLGRNATGYCFITGIGSKSPLHPHHRPSVADGITEPVPGLLVGGSNPGRQDKCYYKFTEPETAYVDSDCGYASNEIAINWNAPLVYLANALSAIHLLFYK